MKTTIKSIELDKQQQEAVLEALLQNLRCELDVLDNAYDNMLSEKEIKKIVSIYNKTHDIICMISPSVAKKIRRITDEQEQQYIQDAED